MKTGRGGGGTMERRNMGGCEDGERKEEGANE